jgi:hypothetical protein
VQKQVYCKLCHCPRYYYVDYRKTCVQCGEEFVFSAREQKYWYETLKFHFDSTAIRCPECRRKRRTERALQEQLAEVIARLKRTSDDPLLLVELAHVTVQLRQCCGQGNLARAVAAARRAGRLSPPLHEALYWEAACHEVAGQHARAAEVYGRFLDRARSEPRCRQLVKQARSKLTLGH